MQVTTARLASTNSLLRDVAAIQRRADQLCPGHHPPTHVMSHFTLDEPESSSHAEHAGLGSSHAESTHGASAVTDTGSKGKEVSEAMSAGLDFTAVLPTASGVAVADPAIHESLLGTTDSLPQDAVPTSAHASQPYKSMDYSKFDKLLDSDSEDSEHACVLCQDRVEAAAEAAAAAVVHAGSNMPSQESEESPLPGIMSELQQAMTDSISSSGKLAHVILLCALWLEP